MKQYPALKYRDMKKKLENIGCNFVLQSKGSHEIRYSPYTDDEFTVVKHKEVNKGTLYYMLKDVGISLDKFMDG